MSLLASRRAAGFSALEDLEKFRYGCYLDALGTTRTWGAGPSKDAAVSYFGKSCVTAIDELRQRLERTTDETWPRWVADADELHRSMAEVSGYRGEWSLRGVLLSTGRESARELGEAAAKIPQGAAVGAGAITFLVGAYIAWKVLG